jgi:hypothetical protein
MPIASVVLHIRPPLSYEITKKAGGLILEEEIQNGETLRSLLIRLNVLNPAAFEHVYDPDKNDLLPPIVTVLNGVTLRRTEALSRKLVNGDKITWFLMYAGG